MAWDFTICRASEAVREAIAQLVSRRQRLTGRAVTDILNDADVISLRNSEGLRRLSYVGKPNRYRALQAQRFLQRRPGEAVVDSFEAEFDKGGLIFGRSNNGNLLVTKALVAYHPHSGDVGPVDGFSRKVHLKRVGGLMIYSYKDKLSQDEVDAFYSWFEKTFRRRLRRPKRGGALAMKELNSNADEA